MKCRGIVLAAVVAACLLIAPAIAIADPIPTGPVSGSYVSRSGEVFTWMDDMLGSAHHWYIEVSTSPFTDTVYTGYPAEDYLRFGFFSGPIVLARDVGTTSVDLAGALPPGTYYWHVGGFYTGWTGYQVFWSPTRSMTVYDPSAPSPRICASPSSLSFSAPEGATGLLPAQTIRVSNAGSGSLAVEVQAPLGVPWVSLGSAYSDGSLAVWPVQLDPDGKAAGTYETSITITDTGSSPRAEAATITVPATLRIYANEVNPPTGCAVSINNGAIATSRTVVSLGLTASDTGSGLGQVRFDDGDSVWSGWGLFTSNKRAILTYTPGVKTVRAQFRDVIGNTGGIVSDTIVLDTALPNRAVVWAPYYSTSVSKTSSFPVKFTATDSGLAGIQGYEVSYRIKPGTTWSRWGRINAASATWRGLPGKTYQFVATSIDKAGNAAVQPSVVVEANVPYDQTAGSYSKRWSVVGQTSAFLGTVRTTSSAAYTTFRVTGRNFSLLVTKGPKRSRAKVFVDGIYLKTIDTRTVSTLYRQAVALKSFAVAGSHTIKIVNAPASGRARLDIDGLIATK